MGDKPSPSGTQRILRSVHERVPDSNNSFEFFNLLPVEQELTISLSLLGPDDSEKSWSQAIPITPEMFVGKRRRTAIDLGEIQVIPEK